MSANFGSEWRPKTAKRMQAAQRLINWLLKKMDRANSDGDVYQVRKISVHIFNTSAALAALDQRSY